MRKALKESHVAAITMAVLLFWAVGDAWQAVWIPVPRALGFLMTAIAIREMPFYTFTARDMIDLQTMLLHLSAAVAMYVGASWISRWVYGKGTITALKFERNLLLSPHA